jgi:hypothetical protein
MRIGIQKTRKSILSERKSQNECGVVVGGDAIPKSSRPASHLPPPAPLREKIKTTFLISLLLYK